MTPSHEKSTIFKTLNRETMNPDAGNTQAGGDPGYSGSGILGAILQAGASVYETTANRKNIKDTNKANQRLADQAYANDLDMWNKMNEYNSPAAQMARFQAAGLNPNMIYGQGAAGGGNANSFPKYNPPTIDYRGMHLKMPIMEMMSAYQDFQMRQAQINNVKAQTQNIQERTMTEPLRRFLTEVSGQSQSFDLETKNLRRPEELKLLTGQREKQQQDIDKVIADIANVRQDTSIKGKLVPYQVDHYKYTNQKIREEINNLLQTNKNLKIDEVLKNLEGQHTRARIDNTFADTELKDAQAVYDKMRNEWMSIGVNSADKPIVRVVARMLTKLGLEIDEFKPFFKDFYREYVKEPYQWHVSPNRYKP